jgi:hypothetical protein
MWQAARRRLAKRRDRATGPRVGDAQLVPAEWAVARCARKFLPIACALRLIARAVCGNMRRNGILMLNESLSAATNAAKPVRSH